MSEDRVIGAFLAVLGAAMAAYSTTIPAPFANSGDVGPAILPQVLGALLAILGLALAFRRTKLAVTEVGTPADGEADSASSDDQVLRIAAPTRLRQILLGVSFVAYIALFDRLGFTLSSLLFLVSTMMLLGPLTLAHAVRATLLSAAVALAVGYVLNGLLGLTIPGVWIG
ncbi:Tripartite tricarboxylate transporter TctB family protein [Devosia crocina]|uniref:Tripartite tricarboxylate transporter TctB family protein n=1 Tax=Devosia crocina TaxID=429728 RepID=A0A1I7N1I3_9HYPH|nr:tripartite tricarboxylate transporter TctB family protein [Devosia crocina]SFV28436.1 Tripartite tricarboxylate transporter TctB family protein [Devosia crocina]